jgi:hypothetical protein
MVLSSPRTLAFVDTTEMSFDFSGRRMDRVHTLFSLVRHVPLSSWLYRSRAADVLGSQAVVLYTIYES